MQRVNDLQAQKKLGKFMTYGSILSIFIFPPYLIGLSLFILIIGVIVGSDAKKKLEQLGNIAQSDNLSGYAVTPVKEYQAPNKAFNGVWDTEWGEISLVQNGIDVTGSFIGANLNGQVTGTKFFFEWKQEGENISGRGVLAIENGLLLGSWGHDFSIDDGGPIQGTPRNNSELIVNPPKEEIKKLEVWMKDAVIDDGRLRGMVIDHPALGTADNVITSSIISKDKDGEIHRIETQNTIYLIHEDSWVEKTTSTSEEQAVVEEPITSIEQMKKDIEEKKEELSEQIKGKIDDLEEKVPEEIKVTDSFQEMKSSVEETIEQMDEKADEAIEEVAIQSSEQMEEIQEKVIVSLEESMLKINNVLERLDKAVMSSDRESIISELTDSQMNLNMTVERIDSTIGYGVDEVLRGGKTIVGSVDGIPHPVSIKVPKSMNEMAMGLRKGQKIEHNVTLSSFNSIRKMLEFVLL